MGGFGQANERFREGKAAIFDRIVKNSMIYPEDANGIVL
jgi:hypothetical protein